MLYKNTSTDIYSPRTIRRKGDSAMLGKRRMAFTLIELAIALTIIGLLVGGILVGRDLIIQARLVKVISEVEQLKTATMTYQVKYDALPGDDPNAQTTFGATACQDQVIDASVTNSCNGDGNGYFEPNPHHYESMRATQHLALAGLIIGSYSGQGYDLASNVWQKAAIGGYYNIGNPRQFVAIRGKTRGNFIMLGNTANGGQSGTQLLISEGALNAVNAKSIDTKVDDGLADGGKVIATNGSEESAPFCTDTTSMVTGTYNLNVSDEDCIMVFYFDEK